MTIDVEVKTLQTLGMFRDVPVAKLKLLAMVADRVTFQSGDPIFRRGDQSDAAYIVLDGGIAISFSQDGAEPGRVYRHSGSILLGEIGILCGRTRSATITATSTLTALRIPGEDFMRLIKDTPELAFAVMRQLAEQIDLKSQFMSDETVGDVAASR